MWGGGAGGGSERTPAAAAESRMSNRAYWILYTAAFVAGWFLGGRLALYLLG